MDSRLEPNNPLTGNSRFSSTTTTTRFLRDNDHQYHFEDTKLEKVVSPADAIYLGQMTADKRISMMETYYQPVIQDWKEDPKGAGYTTMRCIQ